MGNELISVYPCFERFFKMKNVSELFFYRGKRRVLFCCLPCPVKETDFDFPSSTAGVVISVPIRLVSSSSQFFSVRRGSDFDAARGGEKSLTEEFPSRIPQYPAAQSISMKNKSFFIAVSLSKYNIVLSFILPYGRERNRGRRQATCGLYAGKCILWYNFFV